MDKAKYKEVVLVMLPLAIVFYSVIIAVFFFKRAFPILVIQNTLEIVIPIVLVTILAIQFLQFYLNLKEKKKEVEELKEEIKTYKIKTDKLKSEVKSQEKEFIRRFRSHVELADYNYGLLKLYVSIEFELHRIAKKYSISDDKPISNNELTEILIKKEIIDENLRKALDVLTFIRNRGVHGQKITKKEFEDYFQIGEYLLLNLKKIK